MEQLVRCFMVPESRATDDLARAILDMADGEEIVAVSTMQASGKKSGIGVHVTLVTQKGS